MITVQIFMTGLLATSLLTTLATQAIKKLVRECGGKVYTNILASVTSILIAIGLGVVYGIERRIPFDVQYVVMIAVLAFTGWLCATNGYDKVKQAVKQIIAGGDLDGKTNHDE